MFVGVGVWKNYVELEDELTMYELFESFDALKEKEHRQFKFLAAAMGHPIKDDEGSNGEVVDVLDVQGNFGGGLFGYQTVEGEINSED